MFQSKVHENNQNPRFDEQFKTGLINKDAIISIEMWDSDEGHSSDDHLTTWGGTAASYFGIPVHESNISDNGNRNTLRFSCDTFSSDEPEGM